MLLSNGRDVLGECDNGVCSVVVNVTDVQVITPIPPTKATREC